MKEETATDVSAVQLHTTDPDKPIGVLELSAEVSGGRVGGITASGRGGQGPETGLAPLWRGQHGTAVPYAETWQEGATTWGRQEYRTAWYAEPWAELQKVRSRATQLEAELSTQRSAGELYVAFAGLADLGLFILQKVSAAADGLSVQQFGENAAGWEAWLAMCRLMRAGLVGENGRIFYLTGRGETLLEELTGEESGK